MAASDAVGGDRIGARGLCALGLIVAGANLAALGGLSGVSPVTVLLAGAALACALRQLPVALPTNREWTGFALSVLIATLPFRFGTTAALLVIAATFGGRTGPRAAIRVLLTVLAGAAIATGPLGDLIAPTATALEAKALVGLLNLAGAQASLSGNLVHNATTEQTLLLMRLCLSISLIPELVAATAGLQVVLRPDAPPRMLALAVVSGAGVLLNLARLFMMGWSAETSAMVHSETTAPLVQVAEIAVAFLIAVAMDRGSPERGSPDRRRGDGGRGDCGSLELGCA